jgi:hypothetical protein
MDRSEEACRVTLLERLISLFCRISVEWRVIIVINTWNHIGDGRIPNGVLNRTCIPVTSKGRFRR